MANPQPKTENLKPWTKGQSGNPAGKPKGLKSLATLVQEVMGDDQLLPKLIAKLPEDKRPKWYEEIDDKRFGMALVVAMGLKAAGGDDKAFNALRKAGYGDKLDLTVDGRDMKPVYFIDLNPPAPKPKAKAKSKAKPKPKRKAANAGRTKPKAGPSNRGRTPKKR